ncbi:MAG: hypothetical protein WCT31_02300 [Candidatus Micrarchaeia archaeon]|jgi:hypothetical protein
MEINAVVFELAEVRKMGPANTDGINVKIDIPEILNKGTIIRVYFIYSANYSPSTSYLKIGGYVDLSGSDVAKESIIWVKNKKLSGELGNQVLNYINYSASINSIFIGRPFNLNPPIAPPTLKIPAASSVPPIQQKQVQKAVQKSGQNGKKK